MERLPVLAVREAWPSKEGEVDALLMSALPLARPETETIGRPWGSPRSSP
jgi:hypothetical protein